MKALRLALVGPPAASPDANASLSRGAQMSENHQILRRETKNNQPNIS